MNVWTEVQQISSVNQKSEARKLALSILAPAPDPHHYMKYSALYDMSLKMRGRYWLVTDFQHLPKNSSTAQYVFRDDKSGGQFSSGSHRKPLHSVPARQHCKECLPILTSGNILNIVKVI